MFFLVGCWMVLILDRRVDQLERFVKFLDFECSVEVLDRGRVGTSYLEVRKLSINSYFCHPHERIELRQVSLVGGGLTVIPFPHEGFIDV